MEKKEMRGQRRELPFFQASIRPDRLAIGMDPEAKERVFEGSSGIAKEFYERDMKRLNASLNAGSIGPRFQMAGFGPDPLKKMGSGIDLRTGNADMRSLLPKGVQFTDSRIPDAPGERLSAAMKKMNADTRPE